MLQISKSYTFKQLCHKSDNILRKYITQQNISQIDEEQVKLELELNQIENTECLSESLTVEDSIQFDTQELTLVNTETVTVYNCEECHETFELRVDWEVHKIGHDNDKKETEKLFYDGVDKYVCSVCSKQFKGSE